MKKISLNELAQYKPSWAKRVLGVEEWKTPRRGIQKIDAEYDKDKWKKCLSHYEHSQRPLTPDEVRYFEHEDFGAGPPADPSCVSKGNELFLMSPIKAKESHEEMICEQVGQIIERADVVVEFGCAYGFNLWMLKQAFPGKKYIGGEYSANAVRLAGKLYQDDDDIAIEELNFYDTHYSILDRLESPCVLFTVQAVEQLASAYHLIQTLLHYKDIIKAVVHVEPLYEENGDTTLGLMRQRYAQINDYNRDLLTSLKRRPEDIRIVRSEPDVFSCNPFNPIGITVWEPVL